MRYKDESKLIRSIYHLEEITHKYGNNEILERYEDVTKSDLDTASHRGTVPVCSLG